MKILLKILVAPFALAPVSYTHLDVYKRQQRHCPHKAPDLRRERGRPSHRQGKAGTCRGCLLYTSEGDPEGGCIRFLTETESERLMGLPEGWTKYGADGMEIRPLQRYKALGNAIALPCADYIMAGIYEVLAGRAGKEE